MEKDVWYRFWKKSGPMVILTERYFLLDKKTFPDEEAIKYECEDWAERMPGGHNTRYSYGFTKVKHPPKEVLKNIIKERKDKIKMERKYLGLLEKTLREMEKN